MDSYCSCSDTEQLTKTGLNGCKPPSLLSKHSPFQQPGSLSARVTPLTASAALSLLWSS